MDDKLVIEEIPYAGWERCLRIANQYVELVVTLDVGPRIIRYAFLDGENLFKEFPDQVGKTGGDEWMSYGGHRFWTAPEDLDRTYVKDNDPVAYELENDAAHFSPEPDGRYKVQMALSVSLDVLSSEVNVTHQLTYFGEESITLAPWAITVMKPGGVGIMPQEGVNLHSDQLHPSQSLATWPYTNLSDERFDFSDTLIRLHEKAVDAGPQKIGCMNTEGWAAYHVDDTLFVKRFGYDPEATYPDMGCNAELYTDRGMLEVESLGGLRSLSQDDFCLHTESWRIIKTDSFQRSLIDQYDYDGS